MVFNCILQLWPNFAILNPNKFLQKRCTTVKTWLTDNFDIKLPIIMAPMFLVSNEKMLEKACEAGIMGCIPALNYRNEEDFQKALQKMSEKKFGPYGVNLIVNKSNVRLEKQIELCLEYKPDFIITSLGSPKDVIGKFKNLDTKIFCDVVDLKTAKKVESLGADAIIAVNSGAGGHAGNIPASILIPLLKENCDIPIISAGGIGTGSGIKSMITLGADGVSMGSPFIATVECAVNKEYKKACINYGASDIVMTSKISGTPCTVINTPYVQKIGTDQNIVEKFLNTNRHVKKYAKILTYYKGMGLLEKAAFSATYKSVFCAGPSIEYTTKERSISEIVSELDKQLKDIC